jgi:hypothetical protein
MSEREMSLQESEERFIHMDHPARIDAVAKTLGVLPHDLKRALGANRLMLVKSSNRTARILLGLEQR